MNTKSSQFFPAAKNFVRTHRTAIIALASVLAALAIRGQIARAHSAANIDPRLVPQTVEIAKATAVTNCDASYTGIIEPRVLSPIGFRVAGKVVKRYVDKGQTVKKGDPLMSLDSTDYALSVVAATQQVHANEAVKTQAEADRTRFASVVGAGAVSQQKYDAATATADASDATVLAAKAQQQIAEDARGYTTLYAEADGIIVDTLAEPGQVVQAGQPVVELAFNDAPEAVVNLPETVSLKLGTTATAYLMDDETVPHPAHLRQLAGQADPVLRTFEARFPLDKAGAEVRLGSTVTIKLAQIAQWVQVPVGALLNRGQGSAVWVFNAATSTVSERRVSLERITENGAIISAGLSPGETVVAAGAHRLSEGETIVTSAN